MKLVLASTSRYRRELLSRLHIPFEMLSPDVDETALPAVTRRSAHTPPRDVPTVVHIRPLSDAQIEAYLKKEQPYDCAGSAKSESLGTAPMERMGSPHPPR